MVKLPYRSRLKNRSTGSGYKPGGSRAWFSHLTQFRKFSAAVSSANFLAGGSRLLNNRKHAGETACATKASRVFAVVGQAVSPASPVCGRFLHSF